LKHSAATETATASTNRMMVFIGILPIIFEVYLSPFIGALTNIKMPNPATQRMSAVGPKQTWAHVRYWG
jgi:hypothetical protein